ncbi:MAG: hydrolase [Oscillospiraceae bacterium]|nr:hydrolase [Oscillospiraceae bacterium]
MEKGETTMNEVKGYLRDFRINVPEAIYESKGIKIFGRRIKSIVFSTDVSIIRNCNADAVIAVYPFTPQPVITQAVMMAADCPVFAGVGGGLTKGERVINLARHAEYQGATGVVVNAPTSNDTIRELKKIIDLPIVVTVVKDDDDIAARLEAGAQIFNVSAAARTPELVRKIREDFPDVPIMATGGPTEETVRATISAGADAITWTPPSNGEVFRDIMEAYRKGEPHP